MGVHEVGGAPAHTLTHVRLQLKKFGGLVLYTQVRACILAACACLVSSCVIAWSRNRRDQDQNLDRRC